MAKTKKTTAPSSSANQTEHAASESNRPQLVDEEPEPSPPHNDPAPSANLPEATEELESFNTANEKAQSEESDEHQGTSQREDPIPETTTVPAATNTPEEAVAKSPASPTASVPEEKQSESEEKEEEPEEKEEDLVLAIAQKAKEAVELSSASEGTPPVKKRQKRILQRIEPPN